VTLAKQYRRLPESPDLLVASDMLDLATFLGLINAGNRPPVVVYFHENQLVYPWSARDPDARTERANQYAFINFTSALAADAIAFNSEYHQRSFLEALPAFLRQFPDHQEVELITELSRKSRVLSLGIDLNINPIYSDQQPPVILWNHRWEYDKQPDLFFNWLLKLKQEKIDFQLVILGEAFGRRPDIFQIAKEKLSREILFMGYAPDRTSYTEWLAKSDILPVTSIQDFFGGSTVEALSAGCLPVLPRRLAYPEHLPPFLHDQYLYDSPEEGFQILKQLVRDPEAFRKDIPAIREWVSRYDWQNMAPQYDEWADEVIKRYLA